MKTTLGDNTHPFSYRNRTLSIKYRTLPFELLIGIVQETPNSPQALVIALGCPPEPDGTSLFLKTAHRLLTIHGKTKLLQLASCQSTGRCMKMLGGKESAVLQSCESYKL